MRIGWILSTVLLVLCPVLGQGAEHTVTIDSDTEVRTWLFTPRDSGDGPWPLAILIPAGSGQDYTVKAQFWLGREIVARGWALAMPMTPKDHSFVGDSADNISQVIEELQKDPNILPGKTLLLGVSNGGSSALEIASKQPGNYFGVVAVPGRLKQSGPLPALSGLPVFLRIAERDLFRWNKMLPDMTQRLESAGARVDASLVPDARHIIRVEWSELDRWLETLDRQAP